MGKLKQLLKPKDGRDLYLQGDQIDNIVNLGYGGLGTSTAIRSIWNYCDKVEDITEDIQTALDAQAQSTELTNSEDISSDEESSSEDSASEESSSDKTSTEAMTSESIVSDGDTNSETSDTAPATTDEE